MTEEAPHPLRMSLRALLASTAFLAAGCVALMQHTEAWQHVIAAAVLIVLLYYAVVAFVDRGYRQAFAAGFCVAAVLHWLAFTYVDDMPVRQLLEDVYYENEIGTAPAGLATRTPAGAPVITTMPALGSFRSGPMVRALQAALNEAPSTPTLLEVDGDFGSQTRRAVVEYQKANGLKADGVVRLSMWRSLGKSGVTALQANGVVSSYPYIAAANRFVVIGGWLATALLGLIGGKLAEVVYARRQREPA